MWKNACHRIVFLAQAKHYLKNPVRSPDLREFIGAVTCAKHGVYAVHKDPYPDLVINAFAPLVLVYLTSGELTVSAKTFARNSGIIIIASDDLYDLLISHWKGETKGVPKTKRQFVCRLRMLGVGIEQACRRATG
jgi:restriction endonuclease Mrr